MLKRTYSVYGSQGASQSRFAKKRRVGPKRRSRLFGAKAAGRLAAGNYVPRAMRVTDFSGSQLVPRGPNNPFPDSRIITMRYCESFSIDGGIGTPASYLFRANSIFDPNYSGTGHQPYGHDQIAALYNHYEVVKSFITWEFQPGVVDTTASQVCAGITLVDDTTYETNYDTIQERKHTRWTQVGVSDQKGVVNNSFSLKKIFPRASSTETAAAFGASPTEQAFFHCWAKSIYSSQEPANVAGIVTIDYVVRVWELKDLGQS